VSNTGGLLKREAQHIAGQMRAQISNFEAQLEELQKQMQVLETQLHMARLATKRAASYRYNVNGVRYCPNCWIKDESRSRVVSISSGSDDYDLWRCRGASSGSTTQWIEGNPTRTRRVARQIASITCSLKGEFGVRRPQLHPCQAVWEANSSHTWRLRTDTIRNAIFCNSAITSKCHHRRP
jgi:hypothetical protein